VTRRSKKGPTSQRPGLLTALEQLYSSALAAAPDSGTVYGRSADPPSMSEWCGGICDTLAGESTSTFRIRTGTPFGSDPLNYWEGLFSSAITPPQNKRGTIQEGDFPGQIPSVGRSTNSSELPGGSCANAMKLIDFSTAHPYNFSVRKHALLSSSLSLSYLSLQMGGGV
jgi:hypothetical protein